MGWAKYDEDIREVVDIRSDLQGGYTYGTGSYRDYSGSYMDSGSTYIRETRIVKIKKTTVHQ